MIIIEGCNASGKTCKILDEFNNEESILIMPNRTILVYTEDKEMKCKLRGSSDFGERYSDYLDHYHSNSFGIQYREKLQTKLEFANRMITGYYDSFKEDYKFIVIDLDIPKQYIETCNIDDNNLFVTVINNDMDGFKEYKKTFEN